MTNFRVDLSGKTAIVTGAGEGIGRAAALALAAAGARVCVTDVNIVTPDEVAEEIIAAGGEAFGWQADVGNRLSVGSMIEEARGRYGKIDILVNAAGVYKRGEMQKLDEWDWRRIIEINLTGTFFVTQLMGRVMAEEGGGVIINMAASSAHPGPAADGISYVASKSGVIGLTRQAARELAPHNIRVNAVCPGGIVTVSTPEPDISDTPMGRCGTADEVANVVLFLVSDAASFVTGQALNVDGGEHML